MRRARAAIGYPSRVAPFLPPESKALDAAIARRNGARARRLVVDLAAFGTTPARREAIRAFRATLGSLRGVSRARWLRAPATRAWLAGTEYALALAAPPARVDDDVLFELVGRGPHLRELMPGGGLDRRFRRRAAALGERLLSRSLATLPLLLARLTPAGARFGPFEPDISEDGEEARRKGEIHLDLPVPLEMRLKGRTPILLVPGGLSPMGRRRALDLRPRTTIEGTDLVFSRQVVSTRRGLRPGPQVPALARRLGRAMTLLKLAWEEGHAEVLAHTRVVVPLVEKGTVSFSLPERPGVSYINFHGKTIVDLADDLLHESAHHRLHGLEEIGGALDRDDGEPRYRSPWRRSIRPLHGILHAAYTFTWRAELLRRLHVLALSGKAPCAVPLSWLSSEIDFEIGSLRYSLASLADARRRGLLTPAGESLRRAIASRVARIAAAWPGSGSSIGGQRVRGGQRAQRASSSSASPRTVSRSRSKEKRER